jgi:hypothetical protein
MNEEALMKRRDMLAILGMTGAAAAVSTEAIGTQFVQDDPRLASHVPVMAKGSLEEQLRFAAQLEKLAGAIRAREVQVNLIQVTSRMDVNKMDWLEHEVVVRCEIHDRETS